MPRVEASTAQAAEGGGQGLAEQGAIGWALVLAQVAGGMCYFVEEAAKGFAAWLPPRETRSGRFPLPGVLRPR